MQERSKRKIRVKIEGGLGNQMFCYACAYALSKQNNTELILDTTSYLKDHDYCQRRFELNNFNITNKEIIKYKNIFSSYIDKILILLKYKKLNEPKNIINISKNIYLSGFNQRYKIFDSYKNELKNEFTLKTISKELNDEIDKYKDLETISLHLRFGDYVKIGCSIKEEYYINALNKLDELIDIKNKTILVFSDDLNKTKETLKNLKYNFVYINHLRDTEQFELMKRCKHHIISNSTFSYWAAYLNDEGVVVAPKINNWQEEYWKDNYFPSKWIKIETEIKNEKEY